MNNVIYRIILICNFSIFLPLLIRTFRDTVNRQRQTVTRLDPFSKLPEEQELSTPTYTLEELKIRHPPCFSDFLFEESSNTDSKYRKLSLYSIGKYKLIGSNVTSSVSYNHQCQYMMKDRYNCARNNTDILKYGDNPTDWKLTLIPKQDTNTGECNLWDFVHELGGPAGVANIRLQDSEGDYSDNHRFGRKTKSSSMKEQSKRPFIVLMMGNSYLRQTFEALACGWSTDISDYRAAIDSKACYSIECQTKQIFDIEDVGKFLPPRMNMEGSDRPLKFKRRFYRPGVTLPKKVFANDVKDDLAMVEFRNRIRFYFMFRPHSHSNLTGVFDQVLDLDPADVDMLLFNDDEDKHVRDEQKQLKRIFISTGAWQARSIWSFSTFQNIQRHNIGKWFGADNPWITHVPDDHACMPGPVDDMANLLMFLIFSNASSTGPPDKNK